MEQESEIEKLPAPVPEKKEVHILNGHILTHIFDGLSNPEYSTTSLHSNVDGGRVQKLLGVQKRSKSDAKRTQDMSRLAMRILKRNGQDTSRMAMRILKKRGRNAAVAMRILKKRGSNAARIAMRVLRKRDEENQQSDNNIHRVTRASPYSNIGGYFGDILPGRSTLSPSYYRGMSFYEPSYDTEKRADPAVDLENESKVNNEDET